MRLIISLLTCTLKTDKFTEDTTLEQVKFFIEECTGYAQADIKLFDSADPSTKFFELLRSIKVDTTKSEHKLYVDVRLKLQHFDVKTSSVVSEGREEKLFPEPRQLFLLGIRHLLGINVMKNLMVSIILIEYAAKKGDIYAQRELAVLYYLSYSTYRPRQSLLEQNRALAKIYATQASYEHDDSRCENLLAVMVAEETKETSPDVGFFIGLYKRARDHKDEYEQHYAKNLV
ncbi:MAG: sel1 repeat family protein [Gammaproteobacteria bacterium]|nr:sel1 repeat family protein [Gammaproteobacteria bacterium]